ncbi:MAG: hypothetical protein CR984_05880 [Proteobacteria bacterium]|nr:MAG: hypothetical protein CR984_05880 [Pseudomonadota bacterium]
MRNQASPIVAIALIVATIFILPVNALSATATLVWDGNNPAPDGYKIFKRVQGQSYDYNSPCWTGATTEGSCDITEGVTYYFVVRAYNGLPSNPDQESADSDPAGPWGVFNITASAGNQGSITPAGTTNVNYGDAQTYNITPDAGYQINNVVVDGTSRGKISSYTFSNVSANHTISASFTVIPPVTYTINANAGANGSITPAGDANVVQGASKSYTIQPDDGYHVSNVFVDGDSKGAIHKYAFSNVSADHSIHASFAIDTYTISATAGENGSISPDGDIHVTHGANKAFTITADDGYHIANVIVDGITRGAVPTVKWTDIDANHTISVTFAADVEETFSITATAGDGGAIAPAGSIDVSAGVNQTFTITPDAGHTIEDVVIDGSSMGPIPNYTFVNIAANHTVKVSFAASANKPPVADAGPDQTAEENHQVILTGVNSIDPDDGIATFQWRQISGKAVKLIAADQPEARFISPDVDNNGMALEFELAVTDYAGVTVVDTCIVNISWINIAPTAVSSPDQTTVEGLLVDLDASASSDPDDGIAGYLWRQTGGPSVSLASTTSKHTSFIAPNNLDKKVTLTFELTVTDTGGLKSTDTCLVNVTPADAVTLPPEANPGTDQQVNPGDMVVLDGSASMDANGNPVASYQWRQTSGAPVELSDATAATPVFTAPDLGTEGGNLTFKLTVVDALGMQAKSTVSVSVAPADPNQEALSITVSIDDQASNYLVINTPVLRVFGHSFGAVQVVWECSNGSVGAADGTTNWSVNKIELEKGTNIVTFTAYDAVGNQKSVMKTFSVQD